MNMSKASKIQTVKLREKPLKNGGVSLWRKRRCHRRHQETLHSQEKKKTETESKDARRIPICDFRPHSALCIVAVLV